MPGFTVTRGLGPGATPTHLIARGFIPAAAVEAIRIFRGGRSAASRAAKDLVENFKISAMLISHNNKDLLKPIARNIRKTFVKNEIVIKEITPKSVEHRKPKDVRVVVENIKVRNKKNVKH
tara:strand:+ start:792 stop:1154 length:363 start_codon:yes stop_codon:yes gene_type:complete